MNSFVFLHSESKRSCCKPCELTFAWCSVTRFLLDEYLILGLVSLLGSSGVEELDRCLCEGICIKSVYTFASLLSPCIQAVCFLKVLFWHHKYFSLMCCCVDLDLKWCLIRVTLSHFELMLRQREKLTKMLIKRRGVSRSEKLLLLSYWSVL